MKVAKFNSSRVHSTHRFAPSSRNTPIIRSSLHTYERTQRTALKPQKLLRSGNRVIRQKWTEKESDAFKTLKEYKQWQRENSNRYAKRAKDEDEDQYLMDEEEDFDRVEEEEEEVSEYAEEEDERPDLGEFSEKKKELKHRFASNLEENFLVDELIKVGRHIKVTAGGRVPSFSAFILLGNGNGTAGVGYGKSIKVQNAVDAARRDAVRSMITIHRTYDHSITSPFIVKWGRTKVHAYPTKGGGVRAGPRIIQLLKAFGLNNLTVKVHGRRDIIKMYRGLMKGFAIYNEPDEDWARRTGKKVVDLRKYWIPPEMRNIAHTHIRAKYRTETLLGYDSSRPEWEREVEKLKDRKKQFIAEAVRLTNKHQEEKDRIEDEEKKTKIITILNTKMGTPIESTKPKNKQQQQAAR